MLELKINMDVTVRATLAVIKEPFVLIRACMMDGAVGAGCGRTEGVILCDYVIK